MAVGRYPVGSGDRRSDRRPASAVDRSRRESVWLSPRPTYGDNYCLSARRGRWNNRNSDRFRTERPSVRRTRGPNSATASIRTARPPWGDGRLRPACWPDVSEPESGSSTAPPLAGTWHCCPRRRDHPRPTPFGREHTTPIDQTRGDVLAITRRKTTNSAPASPRSSLARSAGLAGLPAVAPGTAGMARLQDARRVRRPPSRGRPLTRRRLGKRGGNVPHTTPALGPAPRCFASSRRPVSTQSLRRGCIQVHREMKGLVA